MFKKVLSLIIIFVAIFSLVFISYANGLISKIFIQTNHGNTLECSHAVDRSGNIYYILKEQNQSSLISLDSTGRQVYKKNILSVVGKDCIFDSIYVSQDKSLLLTVYNLIPNTSTIKQVGVYMFRDDGSFVAQVFKRDVERFYDSKFRLISNMSDDDKNIYFGFLNGTSVDIFAYEKGNKSPIISTNEYPLGDISNKINTFFVLPSGEAIFSLEGGSLLKKSRNNVDTTYKFSGKTIVDRFWFGGNQFYCRDAMSGSIYVSTLSKLDPAIVINGNKVISDKEGIRFGQLDPVAVGNVGNVMGILDKNGINSIFLGGFAFLPEIGKTDTSDRNDLTLWFLLVGILAGTIIVSLLLWDFYCKFLHMRLSILYRQGFLVILVIFLALYFLTSYIIVPKSEEMQSKMYLTEQVKAGQMFIAAFKADSGGTQLDINKSSAFFDRFRENLSSSLSFAQSVKETNTGGDTFKRLAGQDRYETAIQIAKTGWQQSEYAMLAYGENYPDALAAVPLAKKQNAPILLTDKDSLNPITSTALRDLKVKTVYIIGGKVVISAAIENQLTSDGYSVKRIAGQDKYATAIKIAEELGDIKEVAVTTGDDYADALSIGAIAAQKQMPIILVPKDNLTSSIQNYLSTKNIEKAYVIGDQFLISDNVVGKFKNPERILGKNKYDRNIAILDKFKDGFQRDKLCLATGENFADALTGAGYAAKNNGAVALVKSDLPVSNNNFIKGIPTSLANVTVFGGESVVPSSLVQEIFGVSLKPQTLNTADISFMAKDGGYSVAASNTRREVGFPAALMGYGKNFSSEIQKAETNTVISYEVMTQRGRGLCVLMPTGLTLSGSPVTLSMVVGLDSLDKDTSVMTGTVTNYMRIIGLVLVLLVILVEYFNVFNVRKLKKGVDEIAAGDYGREIDVHSGDEIEDLSDSIRALALNILSTTISLDKLNASYYRFVPLRFLEILGETHIENVGKRSQGYKENMVMMFLRFKFLTSRGERSEEIFAKINDVVENIVPIVSENKGTVYNFFPNGFNAVFEGSSEVALQAALRIREVLGALNQQWKRNGQDEVDIRIFITKGNIMLGFIGDEKRMEPAAISNETQKAWPIIQLCFDSDIYIACTEEIQKEQPQGAYRNRKIGEVAIREEKVQLFDLYDSDPYTLLKVKEVHADKFELGVNLFRKGDYAKARNIFMDIIKHSSQDGAARNYMYIAEHNLRSEQKQNAYTTIYELERMR
ncbi:MAG: hypothetical protein APF81_15340 [Desulfosporosinus sp. BRH_c37]|nr:MAG: hypothetical protein APF81_15340 [Desulfosporosinus sp. BRH_c37]